VPSAGLRWIVEAQPRALLGDPAVIEATTTLLPEAELDALARAQGGVDLRAARTFVAAGYGTTTLFLVDEVVDPAKVEGAFTTRVAEVLGRAVDTPGRVAPRASLLRLTGGTGVVHESVVVFGREAVGLAIGPDTPLRAAEGFAVGKLKRARPAWQAAPLDQIAGLLGEAPLRAAAPGPFVGEWALGLGGLLGSASAVGASAKLERDAVHVHAVLAGAWADRATEARERVEHAYGALAGSGLGRLLGLDRPAAPPVVSATPEAIVLDAHLRLGPLARGLADASGGGINEIMREVSDLSR
jgi:hypothetical protein